MARPFFRWVGGLVVVVAFVIAAACWGRESAVFADVQNIVYFCAADTPT